MFKNLFGRRSEPRDEPKAAPGRSPQELAIELAMRRQIAERSKSDPLIGAKIAGRQVFDRLFAAMSATDPRGVHPESLLCALGSVAGYACQASLRAMALDRQMSETALLIAVETDAGATYYFGDHLNKPLAESQYSIWSLAGAAAQQAGCTTIPSAAPIFERVTASIGTPAFGVPQMLSKHKAGDLPLNYVKTLWPVMLPTLRSACSNPGHWPIAMGLAIQHAIDLSQEVLDPAIAHHIVMESAIPMSKVKLG